MPPRRPTTSPHAALYVRLPADEARKLDRAAHAVGAPKKDLVAGLVARYVDPDTDTRPHAPPPLRAEAPGAPPRRGGGGADEPALVVGPHPFPPPQIPDAPPPPPAAPPPPGG